MNDLRAGKGFALIAGMKNTNLFTILLTLLLPACLQADDKKPETNVNERYTVESVAFSGINESKISKTLREEAQKMVGEKYNQETTYGYAAKLKGELQEYDVQVKVERGKKAEHVRVLFLIERNRWKRFRVPIPLVLYHSKQGFSGDLEIPMSKRYNVLTFGLVSDADQLLERNAGLRLRYEHRKIGTDLVHLRIGFDSYHQSFNEATQIALAARPDVPGIYRWRQNFAPSLSVYPMHDLKLSAGVSFQRFQFQFPVLHTATAYAGTADIRYDRKAESKSGYIQNFTAAYDLRTATRVLDSDHVYTRHFMNADYTLSKGKNLFGAHFVGGMISGTAPLFERFSLGNSTTLRGWNRFDVAPLGGTRVTHGSLEYRYRKYQIFYDVGAVWDPGHSPNVRHGFGFGVATKDGFFASLAFPVRLHAVSPVFMLGFKVKVAP